MNGESNSKRLAEQEISARAQSSTHLFREDDFDVILTVADGKIVRVVGTPKTFCDTDNASAIIGRRLLDLIDRPGQRRVEGSLERLATTGRAQALFGQRCRRLDGSCFDADMLLESVMWVGKPAVDISLRAVSNWVRSLAEAATRKEAQLQSILATVPDGMVLIDQRGIVQSFSVMAERLFGYRADEVVGRNVSVLMPSPYREQHDGYLNRYLRTGEKHIIGVGRVARAQRKDGSTFPIELSVGETEVNGERLFTGFIRDLSERQEREQRLHEVQSELIHISRLSELGQMVSALAHEVNQPLSAIRNYASAGERFLDGGDAERVGMTLRKIEEQARRADGIVRRLRAFVRKEETGRRPENLPKLIEEAAALALVGSKGQGVVFTTQLDSDADVVLVDKIQIQQVLLNLMRNAIEAMTGQEKQLLSVMTDRAEPGMIGLSVVDTGPGLDRFVRERLFQPFVTTKNNGLGVGLSICRSIVEAHGGQLSVKDNPGGGTIFRFTLPDNCISEKNVP